MKKTVILHHFLFAVFPILSLFAHNIDEASLSGLFLPILVVLGSVVLLSLLIKPIAHNDYKRGMIISLFLVLFFSYGHIYNLKLNLHIGNIFISRHRWLLLLFVTFFTCGTLIIIRMRKYLNEFTKVLNIIGFSLLLICLINILGYKHRADDSMGNKPMIKEGGDNRADSVNTDSLPDIYYIILDGYASSGTLKDIYDYDNSKFTDFLKRKGFFVASGSRCNYVVSFLSIASALNMEYINYLSESTPKDFSSREKAAEMIRNNRVARFLKSKGYSFIHFSSGSGETNYNKYADINFKFGITDEFQKVLLQTTMLAPFVHDFFVADDRQRILSTFKKLGELNVIDSPKFIFAHIICPHPPFIFGKNGELPPRSLLKMGGWVWTNKQGYIDQVIFVNMKVRTLIEQILSTSASPPIIILQGDHGPAAIVSESSSGWQAPTPAMIKERVEIFNAYYMSTGGKKLLYDSITPVNSFRIVLNYLFNENYKLLDDQSFFSSYETPYDFITVTNKADYEY